MSSRALWASRALTGEALVSILVAKLLVQGVRFSAWRDTLGRPACPTEFAVVQRDLPPAAHRCAAAVERAAARLPGKARCLPQAMALQWMLRRRKFAPRLVLGVIGGQQRGGIDDLHAWVALDGAVLIGETQMPYHPVLTLESGTVLP